MNEGLNIILEQVIRSVIQNKNIAAFVGRLEAIYKRILSVVDIKDEFGMDPVILGQLRPIFEFLYNDWWRVKVEGIDNIPDKGAVVIASNHSGMLPYDAAMINMAVYKNHKKKRNVRFLVADFVENFPILTLFIQRAGGVVASPDNAAKLIRKKEAICVFPEGVRGIGKLYKERYILQDFGKGGMAKLARETDTPIVPCAVVGAEDIHPILWRFDDLGKRLGLPFFPVTPTFPLFGLVGLIPFPSKWKIIFGKPIRYKPSKKPPKVIINELRKKIQGMIDKEIGKK